MLNTNSKEYKELWNAPVLLVDKDGTAHRNNVGKTRVWQLFAKGEDCKKIAENLPCNGWDGLQGGTEYAFTEAAWSFILPADITPERIRALFSA